MSKILKRDGRAIFMFNFMTFPASHLVYRIFVIGFEFIEGDDMPDSKKDEEGWEDESDDVTKRGECERHLSLSQRVFIE